MAQGQKTGGRKEGTPNKVTQATRERLKAVLENELEHLPVLFEEVSARDRLQFLVKLIPYIVPQAEHDAQEDGTEKSNFFEQINQQIMDKMEGGKTS